MGANAPRGVRLGAVILSLLVVLTACTGLPTSGEVYAGPELGQGADEPRTEYFAGAPTRGASPEQIVTGFIDAAISPLSSWETARLFLGDGLKDTWRPEAGVIVDIADDRVYTVDDDGSGATEEPAESDEEHVTLTIDPTAVVDEHGTYTASASGPAELSFGVAKRDDGEWRIVEAPDGIVIDRQTFRDVFADHRLEYFDPTWTYLVPDVRWFPATGNAATYVVRELVNGAPSAWLAGSVASAFAQDIELKPDSVPVDTDQIAHVGLSAIAAGADDTALARMLTQLKASLTNAGVQAVRLTIDGQSSPVDVEPAPSLPPRPDPRALVLRADQFGFLSGPDFTPLEGLSHQIEDMEGQIDAVAVSPDQQVAAVQQSTGIVYRVTADSPDQVDAERDGLIAPLIDPFGYVWTVPIDQPAAVVAWDENLEPLPVANGFAESDTIRAWAMSRDGSRIAAVVTQGGQNLAVVASVRRDRDGRPTGLGGAMRTTVLSLPGADVAWIEDSRIGIVMSGKEGDEQKAYMIDQQIGGPSTRLDAPAGTIAIEFGTQDASARLLSSDGLLYLRNGPSWQQTGDEIAVLATQMGTPQGADG